MNETADKLFSQFPSVEGAGGRLLNRTRGDRYIWGIVMLLAIISLLVVYSATGSLAYKMYKGNNEVYLFRQLSFIVLGLLVVYFLHRINYTLYSRVSLIVYLISVPLLIYTLFFGAEINDGSRWIKLPVINMTIQTSDFARLAFAGLGISVVPSLTLYQFRASDLVTRAVRWPGLERAIYLVRRRDRALSFAAQAFYAWVMAHKPRAIAAGLR